MSLTEEIRKRVEAEFQPMHFEIINESDRHIGHAGHDGSGESHFKLIIVSDRFVECSRVQRQRLVHAVLEDLFSKGLHALSLKLFTPAEYRT